MTIAFIFLSALLLWRQKSAAPYVLAVGILFQFMSWVFPAALIPIEKIWMKIGHGLGWVNTRIILTAVFFLILTPTRFILFMLGKELLDEKIKKESASYWKIRQPKLINPTEYERLY